MGTLFLAVTMASALFSTPAGTSAYPVRLEDPKAVYVAGKADGVTDDTQAIQTAIDRVQEQTGEGIVFLPSGAYRISNTLKVWPGVRVIGFGQTRPTLLLAPNTPGYDKREKYMVFFAGDRPENGGSLDLDHPWGSGVTLDYPGDANPGTFYSAMSNIDLEIGAGNPLAVGVRARYAQHCFMSHMDFRIGSAMAGIHDTGNVGEDLRFFGGKYGIITRTPSPGWPYTLLDAHFEGQTEAAIRTFETGLTLIRPSFKNVPTAISVEPGHTEQLWISDARMENISGPAIVISREKSLRNQIGIRNVVCKNVATFASFRESGKTLAATGTTYEVERLNHGLTYADLGSEPEVATEYQARPLGQLPKPIPTDIKPLPDAANWVNVATLGAKGDGETDDTAAIKAAIAKYSTIYFPSGKYRVTETIHLKPNTVLIGLHPFTTQILIKDRTPAFHGTDKGAVPLIESPMGGTNMVTGIGLDTGGNNPAAVALRWMAGKDSMVQDVKFLGGHGSVPWERIYNADHSADPDPSRKWDSQYPSLWVTNGGGGTFLNLWSASTFAQAGMMVSDTTTEGRVYELSSEHHVRHEVQLKNASNWSFFGLQAEEERGEGPFALPLDIENCSNVLIANFNIYRVISMEQPFPYAVRVAGSKDVHFQNVHCNSNSKACFDSLVYDATHPFEVRQRELASLTISGKAPRSVHSDVEVLASGFYNISGGAVDAKGDFYFVDAHFNRILRWDAAHPGISTVQENSLRPVNLVFDRSGNLIVVAYAGKGTVYSFKPGDEKVTLLKSQPAAAHPGSSIALAVTDFELDHALIAGRPVKKEFVFISPDGSVCLPVEKGFLNGDTSWGVKSQSVIRSFGLAKAKPGQTFYTSGENNSRTYAATVGEDGSLLNGRLFAEQGGEGVAVGPDGNIYIADGQIYVFTPTGKRLRTIHVPMRPTQIVFGGADGRTLFITARTSLYSIRI